MNGASGDASTMTPRWFGDVPDAASPHWFGDAPSMAPPRGSAPHWEADILLADGQLARLRPLGPADEADLLGFWERTSDETRYFRFFSPHPSLKASDVDRFLHADHHHRVALGVYVGVRLIAIGDMTRTTGTEAEVAFMVVDSYHGYGVGGLLLEHLAEIAREIGLTRLTAEVLPQNRKMTTSFQTAGYALSTTFTGDTLHFSFPVEPTDTSLAVMAAREHRADAGSMRHLFEARSVVVVGGTSKRGTVGRRLLRNIVAGEFDGRIYLVNPAISSAFGIPAYGSVRDLPEPVDLAVIAVRADQVSQVVTDCAAMQVRAVVVVSIGFAEAGEEGRRRQAELLQQCRTAGIRLLGPCALGLVNVSGNSLHASMCDVQPRPGPVAFFCQSGPLGLTSMRRLVDRGLGVSSFVSAGNRADVSGNDLLQYWEEDEATEVILCYLETLGNVEKFSRLARRVGTRKPVVALTSGRVRFTVNPSPEDPGPDVPPALIDAMLRQAGVIQVDDVERLFDVAQLLVHQPLPAGARLAVVGDSPELATMAARVGKAAGFETRASWVGLAELTAEAYEEKLGAALAADDIDAGLAVFVPAPAETRVDMSDIRGIIARQGRHSTKPLVAVIPGVDGDPNLLRGDGDGTAVPIFPGPERAVLALRKAWTYAQWRAQAAAGLPVHGTAPHEAASLVAGVLAGAPDGRSLTDDEVIELLGHYGVPILPYRRVGDLPEALVAAEELGWDVVLKATAPPTGEAAPQRVWDQIRDANELSVAWRQLTQTFGEDPVGGVAVQAMGPPGLHVSVCGDEDPIFGPVVCCRITGVAAQVLEDVSYRLTPLSTADASAMIRELRLAPMLTGGKGFPALDVAAVEDLVVRLAQLKENQPDVDHLDVDVLAHTSGVSVVGARAHVRRPVLRPGLHARRLSSSPDAV